MDANPLPLEQFPPGTGPFGARGVLVAGIVEYIQHRIPGGMEAVLADTPPAVQQFFDGTIFLASAVYDLSPLVILTREAARHGDRSLPDFLRARARASAKISVESLYQRQLAATDPAQMAARLPKIFGRFFEPCRAHSVAAETTHMAVRFGPLPTCMLGVYAWLCEGFVPTALTLAGAQDVRHRWNPPTRADAVHGVPTSELEFDLVWT